MFNILEISRMTTHNGPGYRTNVHFMGCPLSCKWCSTPESQALTGLGFNTARCIGCGACAGVCPTGAITIVPGQPPSIERSKCIQCYQCADECYANAIWKYGVAMEFDTLLNEIMKDEVFFRNSGGGVTFSGGECLMHVDDEMVALYAALKKNHVSIGVDTCGCVPWSNIEQLLPYIDFYLWDIKLMDSERHKAVTGVGNELILSNLERLEQASDADIYIRYPLIPGINDEDDDIQALCSYLLSLPHYRELHFLPYHHLGKNRYQFCGRQYLLEGVERQPPEKLHHILQLAADHGIASRIVG